MRVFQDADICFFVMNRIVMGLYKYKVSVRNRVKYLSHGMKEKRKE